MVVSKMLGMKMIILLSVIIHCVHCCHLNLKMSARYKVMCGCKCCISDKSMHSSLISWRDRYLKKLKDKSQNYQSRRSVEKAHHIYETYKNIVIPHGRHIYAKAYDMAKAKMCTYPQSDHALPHWKCILWFCSKCPYINIHYQETNKNMTKQHAVYQVSFNC